MSTQTATSSITLADAYERMGCAIYEEASTYYAEAMFALAETLEQPTVEAMHEAYLLLGDAVSDYDGDNNGLLTEAEELQARLWNAMEAA